MKQIFALLTWLALSGAALAQGQPTSFYNFVSNSPPRTSPQSSDIMPLVIPGNSNPQQVALSALANYFWQGPTLINPILSGLASGPATIPNSVLVNPSMVIGGHTVQLGGTLALACGDLANSGNACQDQTGTTNGTIPLLGPGGVLAQAQGGTTVYQATATGGSANAQTATTVTGTWTNTSNYLLIFTAGASNTAALNLAVDGQTAKNVYQRTNSGPVALGGGEVISGTTYLLAYDGTQFELVTPLAASVLRKSSSYPATLSDGIGNLFIYTAASTLTLPTSTTVPTSWRVLYYAQGGAITLSLTGGSDTINGGGAGAAVTIAQGNFGVVGTDGAGHYYASGVASGATAGSYTSPSITVNAAGIVTSIANGTGQAPPLNRVTKTANYTAVVGDQAYIIDATSGTWTLTLTAPATLTAGWWAILQNTGTGTITLSPASGTIDSLSTPFYKVYPQEVRLIQTDGVNFYTVVLNPFWMSLTSGITFTIPPGYSAFHGVQWGGGGGGGSQAAAGSSGASGGGGGSACPIQDMPVAYFGSAGGTVTFTVGSGGAGSSALNAAGSDGGTTSVGGYNCYGGGAGNSSSSCSGVNISGGGGGGILGVGGDSNGATNQDVPGGAPSYAANSLTAASLNMNSQGFGGAGAHGSSAGAGLWGGAAGGGTKCDGNASAGGTSVWGGAGGTSNSSNNSGGAGGVSLFGGNGGAGNGSAGSVPGGGGGGKWTGTAGAGGAGQINIGGVI